MAFTKSAIKKAIKKNLVRVNGEIASTAIYIRGGEEISLTIEKATSKPALKLDLKILYEDEHLAVIEKPAGIPVSGNSFRNISNALEMNLKESKDQDAIHARPVHRLDQPTTGALLIGKTSSSIRVLNKMFEDHQVQKIYYAIVIGDINDSGSLDSSVDGKDAKTLFQRIDSVASERFGSLSLLRLEPKTGRRHQLRMQLSDRSNPILGDRSYGRDGLILKGKGLYLHAFSLSFVHPYSKEQIHVHSPLPKKFLKIFPDFKF